MSLTEFIDDYRLHREALKQSATDPKTGLIDVNILATGLSVADRQRRIDIAKAIKIMLQSKGKAPNIDIQRLFDDFRQNSDVVSVPSTVSSPLPEVMHVQGRKMT